MILIRYHACSALRTKQAPWDQLIYQGKRPPGTPADSFTADEFRVFTGNTVAQLNAKSITPEALLAAEPDGEIEIARLLNPTVATSLFNGTNHYDVNPFTLRK